MKIKAGQLIVFTSGEYSDYSYHGVYRALKDFDTQDEGDAFMEQFPTRNDWGCEDFDRYGFISKLETRGIIQSVEALEVWTDAYSDRGPELKHG